MNEKFNLIEKSETVTETKKIAVHSRPSAQVKISLGKRKKKEINVELLSRVPTGGSLGKMVSKLKSPSTNYDKTGNPSFIIYRHGS